MSQGGVFYSFPILDFEEIVAILQELDIPIKSDFISKKSAAGSMRPIYEDLLYMLTGLKEDDLKRKDFAGLVHLEDPELHEESIIEINFRRHLERLMQTCGINDFSQRDIITPDPKRTVRILSALINFAKFRLEKMEIYEQFEESLNMLEEERTKLMQENEVLLSKRAAIDKQRALDATKLAELKRTNEDLANETNLLNIQQATMNEEIKSLKAVVVDLGNRLADDKFQLHSAGQEVTKLRGEIVQSPARLRKTVADLAASLQKEESEMKDLERDFRNTTSKLAELTKLEKDLKSCISDLDNVEDSMEAAKRVDAIIIEQRQTLASIESNIKECSQKQHQLNMEKTSIDEKNFRLTKQRDAKRKAAQRMTESIRSEKEIVEKEQEIVKLRLSEHSALAKQLENKIASCKAAHAMEINEMQRAFSNLENQVKQYHTTVTDSMRGSRSALSLF